MRGAARALPRGGPRRPGLEGLHGSRAGEVVVPGGVAELLELVQDEVVRPGAPQQRAGVVDLLDVALGARGTDHLGAHPLQPLEALPAHPLRQHGHRRAAQQGAVEHPAAAVVAGGGPDRLLRGGVEAAGHQPRHQHPEGRPHLVRPGREAAAHQGQDRAAHPGEGGRQLDPVHPAEQARGRIVVPADAEQVQGVGLLHPDPPQALPHGGGDAGGVGQLGEGGDEHPAAAGELHGSAQGLLGGGRGEGHRRLLSSALPPAILHEPGRCVNPLFPPRFFRISP